MDALRKITGKLESLPLVSKLLEGPYGEQLRFLLAGGANTVFGYGLFALCLWLLTPLRISPLVIQWIAWVLSVPFGAMTLKYFAFRAPGPYVPQAMKAYLTYLPAQLISFGLFSFFTVNFHWHPLAGQAAAIVFATVASYLGHKYITFRTSATQPNTETEPSS